MGAEIEEKKVEKEELRKLFGPTIEDRFEKNSKQHTELLNKLNVTKHDKDKLL